MVKRNNKILSLGVDVGNFDTKTQSTVTPSGFAEYKQLPFVSDNYILYNGMYYMQNENRFPYLSDKTSNENMFILSLFGIAKEIIAYAEKNVRRKEADSIESMPKAELTLKIQGEIDLIEQINVGMGLPLVNYGKDKDAYIDYYKKRFGDSIEFEYGEYHFCFSVNEIGCYPQGFAAVVTYNPSKPDSIMKVAKKTYYAVDIGGWTIDIITIVNNEITDKCTSKSLGVLAMYENIINDVEMQTGYALERVDIEAVLKEEETFLPDEIKDIINKDAEKWFERIKNELVQYGLLIKARPVLFLGGGSQLFKRFIRKNRDFVKCEFIPNPKANAKGYAILVEQQAHG